MVEPVGRPVLVGGHVRLSRPDAPVRLLMFHHAAGSAMSYLPLARAAGDQCEPWLIELAGRGGRNGESYPADFTAAVADLTPAVAAMVDRPTVVLGHSLGALLAHAVVSSLDDSRRAEVRTLVLSAARSPRTTAETATHPDAPLVARSRASLRMDLAHFGGLPVDAEPEIVEHALTVLGHDLHLADTYLPPSGPPITAAAYYWYGVDDPTLDAVEATRWADCLASPPAVHAFPGGHFYLGTTSTPRAALRDLVTTLVDPAESARP